MFLNICILNEETEIVFPSTDTSATILLGIRIGTEGISNSIGICSISEEDMHDLPSTTNLWNELIVDVENTGLKAVINKVEKELVEYFYKKNSKKVRLTLKELQISSNVF